MRSARIHNSKICTYQNWDNWSISFSIIKNYRNYSAATLKINVFDLWPARSLISHLFLSLSPSFYSFFRFIASFSANSLLNSAEIIDCVHYARSRAVHRYLHTGVAACGALSLPRVLESLMHPPCMQFPSHTYPALTGVYERNVTKPVFSSR